MGYVIMLNHVHYIISCKDGYNVSEICRDFKRYTATEITKLLEMDNKCLFLTIFRSAGERQGTRIKIWQDDYHPIAIISGKWFRKKMEYIHNNPIRKGFVNRPEDWKYSSARNWLHDVHDVIDIDNIM